MTIDKADQFYILKAFEDFTDIVQSKNLSRKELNEIAYNHYQNIQRYKTANKIK